MADPPPEPGRTSAPDFWNVCLVTQDGDIERHDRRGQGQSVDQRLDDGESHSVLVDGSLDVARTLGLRYRRLRMAMRGFLRRGATARASLPSGGRGQCMTETRASRATEVQHQQQQKGSEAHEP